MKSTNYKLLSALQNLILGKKNQPDLMREVYNYLQASYLAWIERIVGFLLTVLFF